MTDELRECPACGNSSLAHGFTARCSNGNCILGFYELLFAPDEWNALPRRSDIAQAVAAERARMREACEIIKSLLGCISDVRFPTNAMMARTFLAKCSAAQESEGETK